MKRGGYLLRAMRRKNENVQTECPRAKRTFAYVYDKNILCKRIRGNFDNLEGKFDLCAR